MPTKENDIVTQKTDDGDVRKNGPFISRNASQFYLRERLIHWRSRNEWLHNNVSIENLQRVLAVLTFIVGAYFMLTGAPTDAMLIMSAPDDGYSWLWPRLFHHVRPHQFLGLGAVIGSAFSLVALLNWPVVSEAESRDDDLFDRDHLRELLYDQKIGTMTCGVFWAVIFLAAFVYHPSPGPFLCLFAAYVHYWIWLRVSKQYAQDRDRSYQEKRYRKFGYPYRGL